MSKAAATYESYTDYGVLARLKVKGTPVSSERKGLGRLRGTGNKSQNSVVQVPLTEKEAREFVHKHVNNYPYIIRCNLESIVGDDNMVYFRASNKGNNPWCMITVKTNMKTKKRICKEDQAIRSTKRRVDEKATPAATEAPTEEPTEEEFMEMATVDLLVKPREELVAAGQCSTVTTAALRLAIVLRLDKIARDYDSAEEKNYQNGVIGEECELFGIVAHAKGDPRRVTFTLLFDGVSNEYQYRCEDERDGGDVFDDFDDFDDSCHVCVTIDVYGNVSDCTVESGGCVDEYKRLMGSPDNIGLHAK
jgi:hypothetical protein